MSTAASHYLTVPEVAARLRLDRATVYRKIAEGRLPAIKLGPANSPFRVNEAELNQWLDQSRLGRET